jgi:hypothetical protein
LDSFDDFFNFLSTGSFVHTEKDCAASIPAFDQWKTLISFFSSSIHVYFLAELSFSNTQRSLHILYLGVLDDLKHARVRDKFIFRSHQIDVKFFGFFGASKQN